MSLRNRVEWGISRHSVLSNRLLTQYDLVHIVILLFIYLIGASSNFPKYDLSLIAVDN